MLKYAILGLLSREPLTGYDISQKFSKTVNNFWYSTHGQIYPALKKLHGEGLITYETDTKGTILKKKFYRLTEEGREELVKWLSTPFELEPTPKDTFRLQLFFSDIIGENESLFLLREQLSRRELKLKKLKSMLDTKQREDPQIGMHFDESLGDVLVLKGAVMREEAYIKWLSECEKALIRFEK